jgi:hypothetical protein
MMVVFCCGATAQVWEMGALGGYGVTKNVTVNNASSSADAGLKSGPMFGFVAGSNDYQRLAGEASYLYRQSDLKLSGAGKSATFGGHTQFVDFRLLLHFTDREQRLRPFVAIGGGVAIFTGTGQESAAQPLNTLAALTHTQDTKPMLSAAAGLKYRVSRHLSIRGEFRDYVTPFPDKVIAPVPGASAGGWLNNFCPLIGVIGTF